MNGVKTYPAVDASDQIPVLIQTLLQTERRLVELTAGEVDTVTDSEGRTFLLRRAQEQLRDSEAAKQAAILNALPAHIALLDAHGVIISVNEAWRRFANANVLPAPGHGVGLNYLDVCDRAYGSPSGEAGQAAAGIRAVLGGAKDFSIEYPCHSPTEKRWFQLTVTPLAEDRPNGVVVMHLNITERRRVAKALEELSQTTERRERILNTALSSMIDFAQVYDRQGRLLFVNQPLLSLWGLTLEAVAGKNFFDLGYPDELAGKLQRQVEEVFTTRQNITDETPYVSPAGLNGFYEYIFSPVFAPDGNVDLVVGSTRDITERKRAEAALKESESRYHSLFENMLEGYAYCRTVFEQDEVSDFVYLEVNSAFEKLTGLKDVVGKKISELIPGLREANRELFEIYSRVARTGTPEKFETHLEGLGIWLAITVYSREREHFVAVFDNITERKLAEKALLASESEFRALAEAMPQMVWITRPDGWNIYFSQQWVDYTGLTLEESLGQGWIKPFHPDDQKFAWDAWQRATAMIGTYSIECRLRRADGTHRWWLIRGVPQLDAAGRILKWFGTCTDIHDLKSAELEISRANQEQRQLAEQLAIEKARLVAAQAVAKVGSWELNLRTDALAWSDETHRIFETDPTTFEHTHSAFLKYVHPDDRASMHDALTRSFATNSPCAFQHRLLMPDGRIKFVEDRWQIFLDDQGQGLRVMGTCQDITERKLAEAELKQAHRELVAASRQAGMAEVATSVLHNVGNVLNSVNVAASCVADSVRKSKSINLSKVVMMLREREADLSPFFTDDPKGKQIRGYLAQLADHLAGEQAAVLAELSGLQKNIEHIKDIVTMQQGFAKVSGSRETLSVIDLVEDAVKMNSNMLAGHEIVIIKEFQEVPVVNVEKHKVLQILVNLVRNASQACDEANRPVKKLKINVSNGGGLVRIAVADNGMGILPENLIRIFAHGFTTKPTGHGFGLHSSALAARELGGTLTAQSDGPGLGATFTLELPLAS